MICMSLKHVFKLFHWLLYIMKEFVSFVQCICWSSLHNQSSNKRVQFHCYVTGEPIKIQRRRPQSAKCYSPSNDCLTKETPKIVHRNPERPKSDKYYSSPICRRVSNVTVSDSSDSLCPSPHQYEGTTHIVAVLLEHFHSCVFRIFRDWDLVFDMPKKITWNDTVFSILLYFATCVSLISMI